MRSLAAGSHRPSATPAWTILAEADDLRADLDAGRFAEASGPILDRATGPVGPGSVVPPTSSLPG